MLNYTISNLPAFVTKNITYYFVVYQTFKADHLQLPQSLQFEIRLVTFVGVFGLTYTKVQVTMTMLFEVKAAIKEFGEF